MTLESRSSSLPRSTPESQGIASSALLAFVDDVEAKVQELHSFILVRHGKVVAEGWWSPYGAQHPHMLYSLSKSFTSTAAGLAITEGKFSLDDTVLSFFADEAPKTVSANLAAMKVRHLLSMSTGHDKDATGPATGSPDGNWAKGFLGVPVEHEPGTHFVYNSAATYMVSAIVQKTTGKTVLAYLSPRLFAPLGITGPTWEVSPQGINTGGWGLAVKTDDIAKFGQLYLQKGMWEGKQIVPESWVADATSKHISNGDNPESDWNQGYGFQFWRCRHNAYRGDGAFGQYCVVMPDQDAVMAITGGLGDMQVPLSLIWKHILPACQAAPLSEDAAAHTALTGRLEKLKLRTVQGQPSSATAAKVSGKTYTFAANEQKIEAVTLHFKSGQGEIEIKDAGGTHRIAFGLNGAWKQGRTDLDSAAPRSVAGNGAWTGEHAFQIKLSFYETPFCPTIACDFSGDDLQYQFRGNVSFGPPERPVLTGHA